MSTSRRTTGLVPLVAAATPEKSAETLAARHGPVAERPSLGRHVVARRQLQAGQPVWVVKNSETMKYYYFEDSEWGLIELFDGNRTREEIFEEYRRMFPSAGIELSLIFEYEEMLRKLGLLELSVAEKSLKLLSYLKTARQRAAEEKAEGFNPFFLLFHVVNPNRFLNRTVRYVRWLWTPPVVAIWALLALWTIGVFVRNWEPIWRGTYELYAFLHKPLLDAIQFFCLLSLIGGIHELGHAYAVKVYGGDVHDIGIALLYFTPAFYCDTTDALLFPNKWQRLWVTTAGIYIEGFLCSAATALWVASYPDTLLNELAYKTMLFTGVSTVFFNINPLIKIDGYYALSSLLDVPELREDSLRYLGALFQRRILRLPVEVPAVSRRKRRVMWIYGSLALVYTCVLMRFIGGIFYNLYAKYVPDLAVVLLLFTLYRLFRKRVRLVTRTARLLFLDKKEFLMLPRIRRSALATAAAVILLLGTPWTRPRVSSESILRPGAFERIEAPEEGTVEAVFARESEPLNAGDMLFQLSSPAIVGRAAHFEAERNRYERQADAARESGIAGAVFEKEHRAAAANTAFASESTREKHLAVRSPIRGRLLTHRPEDFNGRFVTAGTTLAEVGNCETMVAELPVSERLLDDLEIGAEVRALVPQRPLGPLHGKIVRISPATLGQPPTSAELTEPAGPLARPDQFVAFALFENPNGTLRPGDVVRAKIYSRRASWAARGWRVLRRWVQTILW